MDSKQLNRLARVLSVLGVIVGIYLEYTALAGVPVACPTIGIINCGTVLNSQYANTFGIPNSILGIIFFVVELLLLTTMAKNKELLFMYNAIGIAFVIYFLNIERMLDAICIYCTATHILVISLFIISVYNLRRKD